jgi:hypothetical protein
MSLTNDVAAYLAQQGLGVVGTTIFRHRRPPAPLAVISVHPLPGAPASRTGFRVFPEIQIVVRRSSEAAAMDDAGRALAALHGLQNVMLGDSDVLTCEAEMSQPAPLGEEQVQGQAAFLAGIRLAFDLRQSPG